MKPTLALVLLVFGIVGCSMPQEEKENIAAVTCSIMSETRNMDAAIRVEKMNDARDKIGGEPFLSGDDAIQEAIKWGLCQQLVLNETYDERLQSLKDTPTVKVEFYSNGKLRTKKNYESETDGGRILGYEWYYSTGQLSQKVRYKDGKFDGLDENYYENGQLRYKRNYKDGEWNGLDEGYHENGQLKSKGNHKDGEKDGLWERYYENGQLKSKTNFKDGELDGLSEDYYENGNPRFKSCYKNNEKVDMSYCYK
jgi:antitoxin component YwqK of YwqJK toxin-antitoxin module